MNTEYLPKPKKYKKYANLEPSKRVQFSTTVAPQTVDLLDGLVRHFPKSVDKPHIYSGKGVVIDYAVAALKMLIEKGELKKEEILYF